MSKNKNPNLKKYHKRKRTRTSLICIFFVISVVIFAAFTISNIDKSEEAYGDTRPPQIYTLSGDVNLMLEESSRAEEMDLILSFVPNKGDSEKYMLKKAASAMNSMLASAKEAGLEVVAANAYKVDDSEHQTGLIADLTSRKIGYQLARKFGDIAEGKWIVEHCADFGFIVRYPPGKQSITGKEYAPWQVRYVGFEAAQYMQEKEYTLEEYLDIVK